MINQHKIYFLLILVFTGIRTNASVVQHQVFEIDQRNIFSVQPVYQEWQDDYGYQLSEISVPVFLSCKIGKNSNLTVQTGKAYIRNNLLNDFNGSVDTQIGISHFLKTENIILHGQFNLPSGKENLTAEEFESAYILSLNQFNFRMPGFGQGYNFSLGMGWASPLDDVFVFGIGAAFLYRGSYHPLADLEDRYQPGSELILTGGIDYRINTTSTLSADLTYTLYGTDKIAGVGVFDAGNQLGVKVIFKRFIRFNLLQLALRYRSRGKNNIAIAGALFEERERSMPQQVEFEGIYKMSIQSALSAGILLDIRYSEKTSAFSGVMLYGVGVVPEFIINREWRIPFHIQYFYGRDTESEDFTGLEFSAGVLYFF